MVLSGAGANACEFPVPRGYTAFATQIEAWRAAAPAPAGQIWVRGQPVEAAGAPQTACTPPASLRLVNELHAALTGGGVVLLGEVHDNPQHHAVRAALLGALQPLRSPGVAIEQIRADQQPALDRFADFNAHAARLGTVDDLLAFLDWEHSPWSKTSNYRPLFDALVAARLPIYPGDPPRDVIRKAAKEGVAAALGTEDRARLGLDIQLGAEQDAASLAEIDASHCGMIAKSAQPNMAQAQRYRDAHMADALLRAAAAHGSAILISGNGHVRSDRGVPWYIRARAQQRKVVSVTLVEVEDGQSDPESYIPRDPEGKPATDFVIFTPKAARADPCEGMKPAAK